MDLGSFENGGKLGRWLLAAGVLGAIASLVVGVVGWILAGRLVATVDDVIGPTSGIVGDLAESIEASEVLFERTTEAIESIETASRSTVRTLTSLGTVLEETAEDAGEGVADSLETAVETLPGLISTGNVIDNTMRALSFVGVDYDPDVPLDESLADLEASLAPLPDQIRDQVALLEDVQTDLEDIADDGRELSAVLLEARLDMMAAERVLRSAKANATAAAERIDEIEAGVDTYDTLARVVVVAASLVLLAASLAPTLLGLHLLARDRETASSAPE
ncbi:MAG: hypothetical protein ACLFVZ_07980 [Actinomycetota bacterium]